MDRARLLIDIALTRGRPHRYGPHRSQRADLHLPPGAGPHPLVVLIHGGSWQQRYGRAVMRGLARDLTRRGWAAWNIEYRRVGGGGGWPATFEDVAAAIDHLRGLDAPLDLERANVVGHSAGGHLALWAASREKLPADAPGTDRSPIGQRVRFEHTISLAGVADLAQGYRKWHGGAVRALMGGAPEELPERYAVADPIHHVPLQMPTLLVHGVRDETVSVWLSRDYAQAARAAGGAVELVELEGEAGRHRAYINPRSEGWGVAMRWLEGGV
jgi:acetyl esterase/lipase